MEQHEVTTEVKERLERIAKGLPPHTTDVPLVVVITGDAAQKMNLQDSDKLDPKRLYEVGISNEVQVVHIDMLTNAYEARGWKGVDMYSCGVLYSHGLLPPDTLQRLRERIKECG